MGLFGFGCADLGEQGQCLLPVGQGGVRSLWAQRVAEDEQGVGLAEAVAGVALDGQGGVGVVDGPVELAHGVVDLPQPAEGGALAAAVAELAEQGDRLGVMVKGGLQPPLLQVDHAEVAEVGGLPTEPSNPLVQVEGAVMVVSRLGQPACWMRASARE